jgi:hypothetical protein
VVLDGAQQLAEADSAGARICCRPPPASVGYAGVDPAAAPSRREACRGRRRGLECGLRRPLPPSGLARGRWACRRVPHDCGPP